MQAAQGRTRPDPSLSLFARREKVAGICLTRHWLIGISNFSKC